MQGAQYQSLQRTSGKGVLAVSNRLGRTVPAQIMQEGAARIRLPKNAGNNSAEAVLINTAGGLTGGDRLEWSLSAGSGTTLTSVTQACEKIYRSAGGEASVNIRIRAAAGARVNWLPQETILFDGSRMDRRIDADLAPDSSLLAVEATVFGRREHGESVSSLLFRDRWRISVDGRIIHAEDVLIDGDAAKMLDRKAVAGGGIATATILLVGPDAQLKAAAARRVLSDCASSAAGVSAWEVCGTGKLLARLVAEDSYGLRKRMIPLIGVLNDEAPLPRIWSM